MNFPAAAAIMAVMDVSWRTILGGILPMLAALLAFSGVLSCDFVTFDDREYLVTNPQVQAGLSWPGWTYAWTTFDCANWHPLTWLSLELDATLWGGDNPAGFHATNLALHVANVGLVFIVLYQLTHAVGLSSVAAAFWGVHPLHVESVAWVAERKDVLSTFFLLLTLWAYVAYTRRPDWLRYAAMLALFGLGLLAKPMLVTTPILLILLDVWPLRRISWDDVQQRSAAAKVYLSQSLREKTPMFVMAFGMGVMTIVAQRDATVLLRDVPLPFRVANMCQAYAWYLQKTFAPTGLTVFYPHPTTSVSLPAAGVGALLLAAITVLAFVARRERPYLIVGWLWFVIALLPVIGLLQVGRQAYADRFSYIPHLGLFVALAWGCQDLLSRRAWGKIIALLLVAAGLAGSGLLTQQQVEYWRDSETLWQHALDVNPNNPVAHLHLGDVEQARENWEAAIAHLSVALADPQFSDHGQAFWNWGLCLAALNRDAEAEAKVRHTLELDPRHAEAMQSLINILKRQGKTDELGEWAARLEKILSARAATQPSDAMAQMRWGLILARRGQVQEALPYFERAVRGDPLSIAALQNLAMALDAAGQPAQAAEHYRRMLQLDRKNAIAHFGLAEFLEADGQPDLARRHYSQAWQSNPDDREAKARAEKLGGVVPE